MLLNPYRFSAIASMSFVAASGTSYVDSATTINAPSSPGGIQNGDGLFAILLARSAVTPPSGWTLVASQAVVGATAQSVYVYRKTTVTTGDSSTAFTWTQASAGRMGLAYVVCRSSTGLLQIHESAGVTTSNASTATHNVTAPVLTAGTDGQLFLMAACAVLGDTPATNTWTAPASATLRSTATQSNNRLAVATQLRNSAASNSSPWTYTMGAAAANEFAALTIRIGPL